MPSGLCAGLPTSWIARGDGPRRALLLHCTLASGRSLLPVMERLGDDLSMIAPDLPGHGRSAAWDGQGDYLLRCADMAESLCEGPVDLFGHSFGAVVALALMVRRPDLVRSAVLVEPVFFAAAAGTEAHARHEAGHARVRAALDAGDRDLATERFTETWGAGQAWSEIPAAQRRAMTERIHLVAASAPGLGEDSAGILEPGRLDRVAAPVLLLRGAETEPVLPEIFRTLGSRLPAAREAVVPGAGHMAPLTHPAEVAALTRAHLVRDA